MLRLFAVIIVLTLAGCATNGQIQPRETLSEQPRWIGSVDSPWKLYGRFSVKNKAESWIARFVWQRREDTDELELSTSIGGIMGRVIRSSDRYFWVDKKGSVEISKAQLADKLGFSPPFENMKYWLHGLPAKRDVTVFTRVEPDIVVWDEQGWQVTASHFVNDEKGALPRKVFIRREGLHAKFIIEQRKQN